VPPQRYADGDHRGSVGSTIGTFLTEVQLGSPAHPDRRPPVKLLVDSRSLYTWVSATVLHDLGAQPTERRFIEGRIARPGCGRGPDHLEGFGLAIDPVQRRLIPAIVYGAAAVG
jgi:hypothetical protein